MTDGVLHVISSAHSLHHDWFRMYQIWFREQSKTRLVTVSCTPQTCYSARRWVTLAVNLLAGKWTCEIKQLLTGLVYHNKQKEKSTRDKKKIRTALNVFFILTLLLKRFYKAQSDCFKVCPILKQINYNKLFHARSWPLGRKKYMLTLNI